MLGTGVTWPIMPGNQSVLAMSLVIRNARFVSKRYECLKGQDLGNMHNLCEKQDVRSLHRIYVCC